MPKIAGSENSSFKEALVNLQWTSFATLLAFVCFKTLTYFSILTTIFFYINGRLYNQVYSFSENFKITHSIEDSDKFDSFIDAEHLQQHNSRKDLDFENNPNPTIFDQQTIEK